MTILLLILKIILYIILGSLCLFILALFVPIKVQVTAGDDISAVLKLLFIKIPLYPKKEKKPSLLPFRGKNFKKTLKKERIKEEKRKERERIKKEEKAAKKAAKKAQKKADKAAGKAKPKKPIGEIISLVTDLIKAFFPKLGHSFKIKITKLKIAVATGDAAETAILYGVAAQGAAYLLELLDRITNVKVKRDAEIEIYADFVSDSTYTDIDIEASSSGAKVFAHLFSTAYRFLKNKYFNF